MNPILSAVSPNYSFDPFEEHIEGLASGRLSFHQLPSQLSGREKADIRRRAVERRTGLSLHHLAQFNFDADRVGTQNCENLIGATQIPVGVIGPLRVKGQYVDEQLLVPLATTEGALIASTNRGCRAITEAGGAVVRVENVGITRAPVFRTSGVVQTHDFLEFVSANFAEIKRRLEEGSKFLRLIDIRPQAMGTTVFLRFRFDTGDAMGMNMATIACDRVIEDFIEKETGVECVSLSGNYCVDKKPSAINFQEGRGNASAPRWCSTSRCSRRCSRPAPGPWSRCSTARTCWARSPPARSATTPILPTSWRPSSWPPARIRRRSAKPRSASPASSSAGRKG